MGVVTVSGPRGKISKSFGNCAVLLRPQEDKSGKKLNIAIWFKNRKQKSLAKTMASLVDNMVIGVTKGYRYVMRYGFKRHPMKPITSKDQKSMRIENYLGSKETKTINAPEGVKISSDPDDKEKGK